MKILIEVELTRIIGPPTIEHAIAMAIIQKIPRQFEVGNSGYYVNSMKLKNE